jgi:hypothetical protein
MERDPKEDQKKVTEVSTWLNKGPKVYCENVFAIGCKTYVLTLGYYPPLVPNMAHLAFFAIALFA